MAKAYVLHLPGRPELHARKVLSIYVLPMAMAAHFHLCFTVPWLHGAICRRLPTCVVFLSRPLCLLGISSAHRLVNRTSNRIQKGIKKQVTKGASVLRV